jgi:hypothetical protein
MSFGYFFRQGLQGNKTVEPGVFGFVDDPHASATDLMKDPIVRDVFADHGECPRRQYVHCNLVRLKLLPL